MTRWAILIAIGVNGFLKVALPAAMAKPASEWIVIASSCWYLISYACLASGRNNLGRGLFSVGLLATLWGLVSVVGVNSGIRFYYICVALGALLIWPARYWLQQVLLVIACAVLFIQSDPLFPGFAASYNGGMFDVDALRVTNQAVGFLVVALVLLLADRTSYSLESQLEKRERNHGLFVSSVSHEIRNSLAVLSGYIRRASRLAQKSPEQQQLALEQAQAEVFRLSDVLSDLISISRAESGVLRYECSPIDLSSLLERICKDSSERLSRSIQFALSTAESATPLRALGHERQLVRVLENLLENAVKYSSDDVTVQMSSRANYAVIRVVDRGIGIPREAREKVFERFYRAENARLHAEGSGLGLALDRMLVRAMNGELVLLSSRPGETIFELRLPRA